MVILQIVETRIKGQAVVAVKLTPQQAVSKMLCGLYGYYDVTTGEYVPPAFDYAVAIGTAK